MRSIKFRGKQNGEWVYGNHYGTGQESLELFWMNVADDLIDALTIGQFTGLHDKNGKEIWEGDIIKGDHWEFEVIWQKYGWGLKGIVHRWWRQFNEFENIEVIGNIHENPEILEGIAPTYKEAKAAFESREENPK